MWTCGKKKKHHSDMQESETLKTLRQKEAEILRLQEQNQILLQQKITEGFNQEIEELKKFRTELTDFAKQLQTSLALLKEDAISSPNKQNMLLQSKEEELKIKLKQLEILEKESKLREESIKLMEQEKKHKVDEERKSMGLLLNQSGDHEVLENDQNLKTQVINDDLFQNSYTDVDEDDGAGTPANKEKADDSQRIILNKLNTQEGDLTNNPKEAKEAKEANEEEEGKNVNPFEVNL